MAFNGAGVFLRLFNWVTDKGNLVPVTASRMDSEMDGFATGLSNCITKDGQQTVTASIPWNSQGLTGVGSLTVTGATASTSSTTGAAVISGGLGVGGKLFVGSNLGVEGTTASTATTTGALVVAGGAGVAGRVTADNFRAINQPCFSAHKNATNQTGFPDSTLTKVTFTTEVFDIGSFYDAANSRWTPPAGMVTISAAAYCFGLNTGAFNVAISIHKNGSRFKDGYTLPTSGVGAPRVVIIDRANGTDFYEVFLSGSTASTYTVDGGTFITYFMGSAL